MTIYHYIHRYKSFPGESVKRFAAQKSLQAALKTPPAQTQPCCTQMET